MRILPAASLARHRTRCRPTASREAETLTERSARVPPGVHTCRRWPSTFTARRASARLSVTVVPTRREEPARTVDVPVKLAKTGADLSGASVGCGVGVAVGPGVGVGVAAGLGVGVAVGPGVGVGVAAGLGVGRCRARRGRRGRRAGVGRSGRVGVAAGPPRLKTHA